MPYIHDEPARNLERCAQGVQELISEARALRQALEAFRYDLTYNQSNLSGIHHLIKEAVNTAITEVINQERSKDDGSFLSYLERRTIVGRPAQEETTGVESTDLPW